MKTQNSKSANVVSKSESKNAAKQVSNPTATRRVETRDHWDVIFNHAVSLVVAYTRGQKPTEPRKGFAFGAIAEQPHSRAYAKSLIWGLTTSKAGKALKGFDDLAARESREKIAIAILTDTTLVKGDSKAVSASLAKVEPKRERAFAEAVLTELTKPEPKTAAPKGAKEEGEKSETKKAAPKGAKTKGESKPTTKGGSRKSATKQAAK